MNFAKRTEMAVVVRETAKKICSVCCGRRIEDKVKLKWDSRRDEESRQAVY